jgi:hypothetical protein
MAVENKYVDSDIQNQKKGLAAAVHGAKSITLIKSFEVAAADDNGSVYRVIKNVDPHLIIADIEILNDAITAGTDYDLGLYEPLERGGAAIDADVFVNGIDLSSARIHGAGANGLTAVDVANAGRRIYEHAGHTLETRKLGYDIAFTGNVVGTAAGTITLKITLVEGA